MQKHLQKATLHVMVLLVTLISSFLVVPAASHGMMTSPRSRNVCAFEKDRRLFGGSNAPKAEDCPHCLNLGGTLARCGLTANRNYDFPKNSRGEPMPVNVQATYEEGEEIVIETKLTAHHKGHITVKACKISPGEVPSQDCFDKNPLVFVKDLLYGAKPDENYPDRAYVAPFNHKKKVLDRKGVPGMMFRHRFRLPQSLRGDLVLLQWHYITANSCNPEGYDDYDWPKGKRTNWYNRNLVACNDIPGDGRGMPEQFWNCAEVSIRPRRNNPGDSISSESLDDQSTDESTEDTNDASDGSGEDFFSDEEPEELSDISFCGRSWEQVSDKCKTAQTLMPCPTGKDGECPHRQRCYKATACANRDGQSKHNFCGSSWENAKRKCSSGRGVPCPRGKNYECPGTQQCWADMPCNAAEDRSRALRLRGAAA